MSTIQVKGSYKASQNFVEKGDEVSSNTFNNQVFKQYYQHLINLDNKPNTIILKLMYIIFLEKYLANSNKTFKSFTDEDIINYINECSKLEWSNSYKDNNKFQIKLFLNWMYNYLFYSMQKRKYYRNSINKIITTLVNDLKIKYSNYFKDNYFPHSFRHTKATHLYNNGTPLLYVKEFLGHSTISSTEIYATPDSRKQRKEILKNSETINTKNKYNNHKKDDLDNWLKNNMK